MPIGLLPLLINFLRIGMLTISIASEGPRNKSSGNVLRKQLISNNTATNGPPITSVHSIIQQICTDCFNVTYTLEI